MPKIVHIFVFLSFRTQGLYVILGQRAITRAGPMGQLNILSVQRFHMIFCGHRLLFRVDVILAKRVITRAGLMGQLNILSI